MPETAACHVDRNVRPVHGGEKLICPSKGRTCPTDPHILEKLENISFFGKRDNLPHSPIDIVF